MSFSETLSSWNSEEKQVFNTSSVEETWELARALAEILPENLTLALHGDLGSGKTAFVKGLAKAWHIQEEVTSPTFNLMHLYNGDRQLIHMDAYRLDAPESWLDLAVEDFLTPPWCLAIEWPENIAGAWPDPTWHLYFKRLSSSSHQITIERGS